ncbi:hypothetical protein MBLNU13_g11686t1 [Cladosporium sp. NU13]
MQKLDATLTLALPVNAAQLAAHFQAYLNTLPALNALRACNRFGKGQQCHINKLPVELIQSIAHYYVLPEREENAEQWQSQLRCYEDTCSLFEHNSREELLELHADLVERTPEVCECDYPYDPDDEELSECLGDHDDGFDQHQDNRYHWENQVATLDHKRELFRKHFGLDLWLSTVCLGSSERFYGEAETTLAYLTLPGREERSEKWDHFEMEGESPYGYGRPTCKSGCGMAVTMEPHTSPQDVQRFKRAMKDLELDFFVHETQQQKKPLSLASRTADPAPVVDDTAASYPRPMFLVRTQASDW